VRIFSSMETSASGLTAQRLRLDVIASNLANAESTRTESGGRTGGKSPCFPRGRKTASFRTILLSKIPGAQVPSYPLGVQVTGVVEDESPLRRFMFQDTLTPMLTGTSLIPT